jgi:hypothetical protein
VSAFSKWRRAARALARPFGADDVLDDELDELGRVDGGHAYVHPLRFPEDGSLYMERVILDHPAGTLRLHVIHQVDRGDPHDHPWDFTSHLLRGAYVEETPDGHVPHEEGSIYAKRAEDRHLIVSLAGPVVTLVTTGLVRRDWGFWTPTGWLVWHEVIRRRAGQRGSEP